MAKINLLDFQVANLIAAGEVVERPASAVKELLENAIDAESKEITVEIKKGGITFIRVSDNGCGMSPDDLPIAVKRHATSKIKSANDLDGIMTLGFRGEALAAISSVSSMRIMTKRPEDKLGSLLCCERGAVTELSEIGCKNGTTVIVEELFANVPARRKFLKKDQSEAMAVTATVEKIALSRPDISIRLIVDGNLKFCTSGDGKIFSSVYEILGRDFASKMIEVDSMTDGVEVCGYIGRPDNVRASRSFQNFFINGRYVKSKTATAAIEQAFESYIEVGKFPCCVLYIYIHPTFVDVNVHPTKMEVKFSNERVVFDSIFCAVRNALMQATDRPQVLFEPEHMTPDQHDIYNAFVPVYDRIADNSARELDANRLFDNLPQIDSEPQAEESISKTTVHLDDFFENSEPAPAFSDADAPPEKNRGLLDLYSAFDLSNEKTEREPQRANRDIVDRAPTTQSEVKPQVNESRMSFSLTETVDSNFHKDYRMLGTAFRTYIFAEIGDKVMIIDKHAAHERILFEQMKKITKTRSGNGQTLLVPLELTFTPEECDALENYRVQIESTGFAFEVIGKSVRVNSIPSLLDSERATAMLETLAARLSSGTGDVESTKNSFFEEALYQGSCKAAIKAGQYDSDETMEWIVKTLCQNPEIICCPHGRPVAIELSKHEIEHLFKRI